MKKNRAMRIAALLLVLTMMTSCFVGGTFAKYVTEGKKAQETARVAHWGVTIDVSADDAFAKTYEDEYTDVVADITVSSSNDDEVVAPGTNGTLFTMNVKGTPEVDTKVTTTANLELVGWTLADDSFYCPIVFTIDGNEYAWENTYTSLDDFEKDIEDAITNAMGTQYQANDTLDTDLEISWRWDFENGENADEIAANDAKDTYLGDCAAGLYADEGKTASTISLEMSIKIEQVD